MIITKEVYEHIVFDCPQVPPECGGILGIKDGIVCAMVMDRKRQPLDSATYIPNTSFLNKKIQEWALEEVAFCGIFHSHLPGNEMLSAVDKEYIHNVLSKIHDAISVLYFPLVFPGCKLVCFRAEWHGGIVEMYPDDIIII